MKLKMKIKVKYKAFMYIYQPQPEVTTTPSKIIKPVFLNHPQVLPTGIAVKA